MTEIDVEKLRIEIHTGDGRTLGLHDDWTLFEGDVAIMDEDGFRSRYGPRAIATAILAMADERERLREELAWYGEQVRLARLIHSEGDSGRHALAGDGGKRARSALNPTKQGDRT